MAGSAAEAQSYGKGDLIIGPGSAVSGSSLNVKSERIRIWGIDAPERGAWCYRNGRRWKPASDATEALRGCVRGKTVTCRVHSLEVGWFRTVYTSQCWTNDGQDVGACMVRSGWATDYTCYSDGHYRDLEAQASSKGTGLWLCDVGLPTRRWGKGGQSTPCESPPYKPTGPAAK
jgi:endonuclease YncB( thermonuclease family)